MLTKVSLNKDVEGGPNIKNTRYVETVINIKFGKILLILLE